MPGTVDEEKFLSLQMENRQLKKEAVERDKKFKQTLARLARAEEAAKRATLASASSRSPGGPVKGAPTAARLFAAEQRASELEEECRELTRKLQREHERSVHFKNMCKEYKVKLEEAMKAARLRPAGIARSAAPEFPARPARSPAKSAPATATKADERVVEQLRLERIKTAALANERDELRRLVHAAGGKVPDAKVSGASVAGPEKSDGSEWVLEHFVHEQQTYLLDRQTLKVYTKPESSDDWPEPVGRLVGGRLHKPSKQDDLFKALDAYLKREQIHLKEVFDKFDSDKTGAMSSPQLGRFLQAVMPSVTPAQQRYFRAMCDINNDGKVTYQELVESLKNCIGTGDEVATKGSVEVLKMIHKLREYITANNSTASSVFHQFDKDNSGALEQRELVMMFEKLVPSISLEEKRYLLSHIHRLDLDGDGKISLSELRKALRAVQTKIDAEPPREAPSTQHSSYITVAPGQMTLKEHMIQGRMYLLDASKGYVYEALSAPDAWLKPLGKLINGVIERPSSSADLVASLDVTLKKQKTRLKDVFDSFDSGKKGSLETSEMMALLRKLMPSANAADLSFFQILVDTDGAGRVVYQDFVTRIKDIVTASQAFSERGNMDVERVLQAVKSLVRSSAGDVRASFTRAGKLAYAQVLDAFARHMSATAQDRRVFAAFVRQLDLDNSGTVSYEELAYALRTKDVVIVGGDGTTPSANVPQPRQGTASEWYLEHISLNGHSYLVDRHTMRVYNPATGDEQWPQLVGKLHGSRLVLYENSREQRFIFGLDNYLKSQHSRLKDVFDTFDRDQRGTLDKVEVAALVRALVPDASAGDVQYFRVLLDIDCDGEVSYDDFVNAIKDAIAAGEMIVNQDVSPELVAVLKLLNEYVASNNISLAQAFDQFDENKTGYLTHSNLMRMLKTCVPNLSPAERRSLATHLRAMDADGDGRVTLAEFYQAFRLTDLKIIGGSDFSSAIVPYPTSAQAAESFRMVDAAAGGSMREQASEVALVRQQLRDAKAQCAQLEQALKKERESGVALPHGESGGVSNLSVGELQGEIKSAWERAGVLQKRYHEAQSALSTMKANHTRVLQQLDETHKRLNQERKENLKLSSEEKRLAMELEAARELEPMLEQARNERLALEKENHQLLAAAMNAPSEAQSETRRMRSLMAEAQRERAAAELREAELKRTVQALGGGGVEAFNNTRAERDRLRVDCSRMEVELEAVNDKIRVMMEMGGGQALAERELKNSELALADDGLDEGALRAELRGLRETYSDQVEELRKAQRLLTLEEQQVEDLRAALSEEKIRSQKLNENLYKKVRSLENELDRRQKKIHKLEAQLRQMTGGGSMVEAPEAKTIRASVDGSMRMSTKEMEDDLADLQAGENIFELRLLGVDIDGGMIGEDNPATFMTVDFFEHETQATAVHQGLAVTANHTLQYIVKVDDFFLEYLDTKRLPVELNKSLGMDFATVGVAHVNLAWVLDDVQTGHDASAPPVHFCDVIGRGGKVIARLRYAAFMRKNIVAAVREYRRNPPVRKALLDAKPTESVDAYAEAFASAAEMPFSSMIRVEVSCCRDLVPRVGNSSTMVPYCSYQLLGLASHDTGYGRGSNPDFNDVHNLPLQRTKEVEAKLVKSAMEVIVFDDADADLEGAGVIGIARVDLEPLSKGMPVQGAFPLFSQTREQRGTVYVSISWKDAGDLPAPAERFELPPPARGAAKVSEMASDPLRASRELEEDVVSGAEPPRAPPSPMSVSLAMSARGKQRYDAVQESVEALPTTSARAVGNATDSIVISIGQFELGKALYHDHRIRQMFMLFEFMPKFHRDEEQQTQRVKKESSIVDFGYTRAFPVKDSGLRAALAALLHGADQEEATIPFCLVSDDNGIDFEDVGFFELKLTDIYEHGDYIDRRVGVLDKNDVAIGHVTVSVVAQEALRAITLTAGK